MSTGRGPLVSKQTVREHARFSDLNWQAAVRAFDPYPQRLRTLAVAAREQGRVLRLGELAEMRWKPREDADQFELLTSIQAAAQGQGSKKQWAALTRGEHDLRSALETGSPRDLYTAFEALADAAEQIADAIDPPSDVDQPAQPGATAG